MKKIKKWEFVSKEKLGDVETSTFRQEVSGGHIYLIFFPNQATMNTQTVFVPDIELSSMEMGQHYPGMIDTVKREVSRIESTNWDKGEYKPGLIPDWARRPKNKPDFPDHLPEEL